MMAQYSVPFCVALALHRDPSDPRVFGDAALGDASIRRVCRNTTVSEYPAAQAKGRFSTRLTVTLKDGRELTNEAHDYEGMPARPLTREQLGAKFLKLTSATSAYDPQVVLTKLETLETMESVTALFD
jgi:2-methylcitrate dehydratase PrpD